MCGILCCISKGTGSHVCPICSKDKPEELLRFQLLLQNRGPDVSDCRCIPAEAPSQSFPIKIHLEGHVLWTQGPNPLTQPFVSKDSTKFFLFNGDIYSFGEFGMHCVVNSVTHDEDQELNETYNYYNNRKNDGQILFELLCTFSADNDEVNPVDHFMTVISSLEGSFAFIFYDVQHNQVWFCRDFFGRQSLLASAIASDESDTCSLVLSSVSTLSTSIEVPSSGLFCYDLTKNEIKLFLWNCPHERLNINECTGAFCEYLGQTFGIKVKIQLDKTIHIGKGLTTMLKYPTMGKIKSHVVLHQLLAINETVDLKETSRLATEILSDKIAQLLVHLRRSIRRRVFCKPSLCKKCISNTYSNMSSEDCSSRGTCDCDHTKVGVLFSGGLDSMILAYLTAEALASQSTGEKSIDLINVAFFQDEQFAQLEKGSQKIQMPPDRLTGLESFKILDTIFIPLGVQLNFIPVNVLKSKVTRIREEKIRHLISPLTSVLDDSLGCCLWFATEATSCGKSTARILLLGSGADELFGGYGRHRSAFESKGWCGLAKEMQLEIDRISIRNMGRDNRIVSDHGVVPRLPFLDENVVRFATQECEVWEKCCPLNLITGSNNNNSSSLGDKILLRTAAMKLLSSHQQIDGQIGNLVSLALFPKRAMQFGSRIAKLENSKEKGSDKCQRLI